MHSKEAGHWMSQTQIKKRNNFLLWTPGPCDIHLKAWMINGNVCKIWLLRYHQTPNWVSFKISKQLLKLGYNNDKKIALQMLNFNILWATTIRHKVNWTEDLVIRHGFGQGPGHYHDDVKYEASLVCHNGLYDTIWGYAVQWQNKKKHRKKSTMLVQVVLTVVLPYSTTQNHLSSSGFWKKHTFSMPTHSKALPY